MKTADLLRSIARASERSGRRLEFVRSGSRHDIWRVGRVQFSIPRHREVGEKLALAVMQSVEWELGKGWWR